MNKYFAVLKSDMKNALRDPMQIMILVAPLLIICLLRFGFPLLMDYVPQAYDYRIEAVSFFALMCAVFPAIIMTFILFDEKDIHLFPVIRATPVSLSGFLKARMLFIVVLGFITSLMVLLLNGIYTLSFIKSIQVSLLAGLNAPILTLLSLTIAKNKVEGLMIIKAATVTLIIPVLIFFIDKNWEYALGVFPAFWVYALLDASNSIMIFIAGIIFLTIINCLSFVRVLRTN
jgi:hypothetical protein